MRSPLLDTPGAVAAQGPDESVAAHYGDPYGEQRALVEGVALVDRSNREVVRISGHDRLTWLNDLSSQKVDTLAPGTATETLILDPQGRVEHHLSLVDDGAATWIHVEPGTAGDLLTYLVKMRFMLRVEVADLTAEYAVVSTAPAPASTAEVAGAKGAGADLQAIAEATPGAVVVGTDLLVPRAALTTVITRPAGLWAYDALRIEAHRPRLGFDTDHKTIPHEVGWIEAAVHLSKGCYRGQETVARVHNLGHPPRRLVFLHLDGSVDTLPPHGTPVTLGVSTPAEGDPTASIEGATEGTATPGQIGFIGSSARHHELGPIALAVVKRTIPVDIPLLAGHVAATQEVIVPPDAGRNVTIDPALRRRLR
ncbi:folate-binding protein [Acrocarpospora phusangensis]|uniref:Folate-binding protein n=1 Tax=Acrocarpospora phusangensis TaxID=1070424 RepID=A0A919UQ54_9ACTN|nr:folate-binding protein YgfZ [Acrocarpospora phusangensis]GIH29464.1 folate-binding protein [Acrocarpospora phusangensis]